MRNIRSSSVEVKQMAYQSIVRPVIEYASIAWSPHQQNHKDMLEKVNRRAVRKVLSKYGARHSPTEMLQDLGWKTMEERRKTARLTAIYKILSGEEAWKSLEERLGRATFQGRGSHPFKISQIGYNTNIGKGSFLGATTKEWNELDMAVLNPWPKSADQFRIKIVNTNE
jgi:hypothetical protein